MPMSVPNTAEVMLRLDRITKRFPGVVANDAISLELRRGEIHCLLGENGAGKSTLVGILAGLQQPDEGHIEIAGRRTVLGTPAKSISQGIGVVHQHSTLVPNLTVLENVMLGDAGRFWLGTSAARARLEELGELLGATFQPHVLASDLGLGQQQHIEIAKAMWRDPAVLILDEPTSLLVPEAAERLFTSIEMLKSQGIAILFISHKLHEAYAIGDAFTVLRAGRVMDRITPVESAAMTQESVQSRILEGMFGERSEALLLRDLLPSEPDGRSRDLTDFTGQPVVLGVEELTTRPVADETHVTDLSLGVRAGEIVGVAGIDGNGQRHLAEAIAGQREAVHGKIAVDGVNVTAATVKQRQRLGVRYVTDDRLGEGIVGSLSVALNLVLKRIGDPPFWRSWGRMNRAKVTQEARAQIRTFDIRAASEQVRAGTLSGGNIQKILLARELSHHPRVVIFRNPTSGLDLKTVIHVHETIRRFAAEGGAALLISSDLDELVRLADRILTISGGKIVGEVSNDGEHVIERVGALLTTGATQQ